MHYLLQNGSPGFTVIGPSLAPRDEQAVLGNAARVLRARNQPHAAALLESAPFRILEATNDYSDDFAVLIAAVPLDVYERLRRDSTAANARDSVKQIAAVVSEIGSPIRHVVAELQLDPTPHRTPDERARALTAREVDTLVHRYIGVEGGYLGDFSYRSHHEFYIQLGLDVDPYTYQGTTRERFTRIILEQPPAAQAAILDGVLARFPAGTSPLRTPDHADEVRGWVTRLRGAAPVPSPAPTVTTAVVERALRDAEQLIRTSGATSGVDRAHTALHGYLLAACEAAGVAYGKEPRVDELLAALRDHHPAFAVAQPRSADVTRLLRALGQIAQTLNPLRNNASVAHPAAELLDAPEAMLAINAARTVLHYLDAKLGHVPSGDGGARTRTSPLETAP